MLETVKLFKLTGLETLLIICDGASANLTTLNAVHGHIGAYNIMKGILQFGTCVFIITCILIDQQGPYEIRPAMINPFNPLFWLICPTHQVSTLYCVYCCYY